MDLLAQDLRPSKILTRDAFENAMRVGMAVGGSTNMVLHFMAMAKEAGVDVSFETWMRCRERLYARPDLHDARRSAGVLRRDRLG